MRILLLIVQYPPDVNSTGLLMEQVMTGLVERGHEVTVATTFPHYDAFRVPDEYRGRLREREVRDGVEVIRWNLWAKGTKDDGLHRFLSYATFNATAALTGLTRRKRFDVVMATNGSFFSGLTGAGLAFARRAPFVLNVQDLYPDVPIRAGQITNGPAIAALRKMERAMYRRADRIAVITPAFAENLRSKGVDPEKLTVVPNFVDTGFIRPLPKGNEWTRAQGLERKFVVSHAGNVGVAYDLAGLLEAAKRLEDLDDLEVVIVGEGVAKAGLVEKAERMGLTNVRFLPFQPRADLPWLRAASDVQVALYRHGAGNDSMPSKVYEIMASGRPLLASADAGTDVRALVEASGAGICVEPEDPGALAKAIRRLHDDPLLRETMARRGRTVAETKYSREAAVEAWEEVLAAAVDGRAPEPKALPDLPSGAGAGDDEPTEPEAARRHA